ncbi:glycoside hydrolase family 16 protein [Collybiopsis luxurians FD-317 M1]|uniref:Glycoside hydrolase family 16 protein n=1 Tax=Collybiopsis luxurians FD-317 M1 TaxID=944289 RepID=A0A0D0C6X5_9AGAR|nr:glycoside hydrolase family 16 protein [Collybiopsis luxurians FD-317 M1]
MFSLQFFLLSLPLLSLAGHGSPSFGHKHRRVPVKPRSANYTIEDSYQGNDFLDSSKWTFFSDADPTHGLVNYLDADDAKSKGLAYVQGDGTTILAVDNYTTLSSGQSRNSVRIATTKSYNSGLFIADFWAMPHGCSLWPAYWSVGPNWPNQGEIDIIEGVNLNTVNQMTLHTSADCAMQNSLTELVSGNTTIGNLNCASSGSDNTGCAFTDTDSRSYGHGFNLQAGGVFAHEWTSNAIKIWFFSRNEIPSDITNKNPDPSTWGTPSAVFNNDACDIASHFSEHTLTLDITLCGDWSGAAFSSSGCSGTCQDTVADPSNFDSARWEINYIEVYQSS